MKYTHFPADLPQLHQFVVLLKVVSQTCANFCEDFLKEIYIRFISHGVQLSVLFAATGQDADKKEKGVVPDVVTNLSPRSHTN